MKLWSLPAAYLLLGLSLQPMVVMAQFTVTEANDSGLTPEQFVREWLIGNGVSISNVMLNGRQDTIPKQNAGFFTAAGEAAGQLNMASGILLTSGRASNAEGPNDRPNAGFRSNSGSDADLEMLTGTTSLDACVLEFDFIPQCDTLRFRFAFGSEEFYEFCGQSINDAFGFFLRGPGINGTFSGGAVNLATLPSGFGYITINSICNDSSSAWNNAGGAYLQYDVITHVVTAWHIVTPGLVYHLKFAICDDLDYVFDSGVFLEKGSFSAGTAFQVNHVPVYFPAGDTAVEGCNDIALVFSLDNPLLTDYYVTLNAGGTAQEGTDYPSLPDSILFPAGMDSVVVLISPVNDDVEEGDEWLVVEYHWKTCSGIQTGSDTLIIADRMPLKASLGGDQTVCPSDTVHLMAMVEGGFGPFYYGWPPGFPAGPKVRFVPEPGMTVVPVAVSDRCGATASDTIVVTVDPVARLTNDPPEGKACSGVPGAILLTSNITAAAFSWFPTAAGGQVSGYISGTGATIDPVFQLQGEQPGWVEYLVTVSGNGCDTTATPFKVDVFPVPQVELGPAIYIPQGTTASVHAGPGHTEYLWSDGSRDSLLVTGEPGIYGVVVTNQYGCQASDSVEVSLLALYMPNAFTPNGDGINDRFRVTGFAETAEATLQIYNRWGLLLYETIRPGEGWDGTYNGEPCPVGTYVWIIRFRSGFEGDFRGMVTIVR